MTLVHRWLSSALILTAAAWTQVCAQGTDQWISDSKGCKVWVPNPRPNASVTWSGTCPKGFAEGQGAVEFYIDGRPAASSTGTFREGKLHGQAVTVAMNGTRYEGSFVNGRREGKGVLTSTTGHRYEGQFLDGKFSGSGALTFSNGNRCEGTFKDGKLSGRGTCTWKNGSKYEGEFLNDRREGKGVFTFTTGERYEGEFLDGKYSGSGALTFPNGDRYEGTFKDGTRSGRGTFTSTTGQRYEGQVLDGQFSGSGALTFPNGDRYEGTFKDGKRSGRGTYTWKNGNKYEGEFLDEKFHGSGTFTKANGERLISAFREDKAHGRATIIRPDGTKIEGEMTEGKFVADSTVPQSDRQASTQSSSARPSTNQTSGSLADLWRLSQRFEGEVFPSYVLANATRKEVKPPPTNILGDQYGSVGVEINNKTPGARIRLVIDMDPIARRTIYEATLPAAGTYHVIPKLLYRYQTLESLVQPTTVNLSVALQVDGVESGTKAAVLRVRSVNDVPFARKTSKGDIQRMEWMFAAFVNENHPWIDPLLREALNTGRVRQFNGYQAGPENVLRQVEAIWVALQRRRITYSSITTPSGTSEKVYSQHVRFFTESVEHQQANCIDGTVMLASILQKIGIDSFLLFVPGHAYLGFYMDQTRSREAYIETTAIGNASLNKALQFGYQTSQKYAPLFAARDPRVARIVVSEARKQGVMPISR